jgi:hypothetical protein
MVYWKLNARSVFGRESTARDANLAVCRLEEVVAGRTVAGKEVPKLLRRWRAAAQKLLRRR